MQSNHTCLVHSVSPSQSSTGEQRSVRERESVTHSIVSKPPSPRQKNQNRTKPEQLLLHDNLGTDALKGLDDLLCILLRHGFLENLGHALDELLAIDQRQTEQALDLLNGLGLGCSINLFELQVKQGLLLGSGGRLVFLNGGGGGGGGTTSHGEAANGEVGDVQASLREDIQSVSLFSIVSLESSIIPIPFDNSETHLQGGHQVRGLQQRQLANLINDRGDLGVGRSGSSGLCFRRLPSPAGRPLRQICGGRKAQRGSGGTDELSAASGCGLSGNRHNDVRKRYAGGRKEGGKRQGSCWTDNRNGNQQQSSIRKKESRSFGVGKSSAGHVPDPLIRKGL